jgi:putative tricarboxylic transport membrane protein
LILGPMLESNFRRSLILSEGDPLVFVRSPISATLLLASVVLPAWMIWRAKQGRAEQ